MYKLILAVSLSVTLLSACGVEVAGTAVASAKLQAVQLEQAKAQQEQVKKNLAAALQAGESAASAAVGQ